MKWRIIHKMSVFRGRGGRAVNVTWCRGMMQFAAMGSVSRGDSGTAPGNRRLRRLRSGRCEGLCGNLCEDICGKTSSRPSIATGPRGGTRTVRSGMVPVEVESIPLRWEKDRCGASKTVCCALEMGRVPEMEKQCYFFILGKDLRGFAWKMCLEMKNTAVFSFRGRAG